MTSDRRIAGLVLAAGRSTRMGHFKLLAEIAGKPMVRHVAEAVTAARVGLVVVVTGNEADAVRTALSGLDVRFAHNPNFADGLATSLAAGLAALPEAIDGAIVALGDMPEVSTATIDALIAGFAPDHVVVPVRDGEIGNPILWPREAFQAMRALQGDAGARRLLPQFEGRIRRIEASTGSIFCDVDTPEALAQVRAKLAGGA